MDTNNVMWILVAASLVFLMTPGMALVYGGLTRARSVLNMLMLSVGAMGVTTLIWALWGWSVSFAGNDIAGIFGDPVTGFLLKDSIVANNGVFVITNSSGGGQSHINIAFQMALAMLAVAVISGALADRIKYSTWMIFVAIWVSLVYAPMAHMTWGGGLLSSTGAISQAIGAPIHDFSGGSVVFLNAATSAVMIILIIGKRKGSGQSQLRPHNVPLVLIGAFLLWFGWFGLSAGSALSGNNAAGYVWISTAISAAAGMLAWGFIERIRTGHYTVVGAASGLISGLVAISPAANVVSPLWAIVIGALAGVAACFACRLKIRLGYDDSLDVVGIQGISSLIGLVLIGFFADGSALLTSGNWKQLVSQLCLVGVTVLYSGAITAVIAFVLEKTIGWSVGGVDELKGVDITEQGEHAYDLKGITLSLFKDGKQ